MKEFVFDDKISTVPAEEGWGIWDTYFMYSGWDKWDIREWEPTGVHYTNAEIETYISQFNQLVNDANEGTISFSDLYEFLYDGSNLGSEGLITFITNSSSNLAGEEIGGLSGSYDPEWNKYEFKNDEIFMRDISNNLKNSIKPNSSEGVYLYVFNLYLKDTNMWQDWPPNFTDGKLIWDKAKFNPSTILRPEVEFSSTPPELTIINTIESSMWLNPNKYTHGTPWENYDLRRFDFYVGDKDATTDPTWLTTAVKVPDNKISIDPNGSTDYDFKITDLKDYYDSMIPHPIPAHPELWHFYITAVLDGNVVSNGILADYISNELQHKTIWSKPTGPNQIITADTPTYAGLSQLTILENSEGYIVTDGTLLITSEGLDIDVTPYRYVDLRTMTKLPPHLVEELFTSYTISEGVTKIGAYAFQNADRLTNIIIPDQISSIGDYAFNEATSLTTVTYEPSTAGLNYTGKYAFENCTALTTVNLPDTIKTISDSSFINCPSLTTIDLPDTLTEISQNAFKMSSFTGQGLANIVFPDSLKTIQRYAFQCTNLEEITIPSSITLMGRYVFSLCRNLKRVNWDTSYLVQDYTFSNCDQLTDVTLSSSCTEIGTNAFYSCYSLGSIDVSNIKTHGSSAFCDCYNLERFIFGNDVTTIPGNILYMSTNTVYTPKLNYIYIPSGVTSIGTGAFLQQSGISGRTLVIKIDSTTIPTIGVQRSNNTNNIITRTAPGASSNLKIYVPDELYDAYIDPSCNWSFYANCIYKQSEMP